MGRFIKYLSQFSLTILLFAGFSPVLAAEITAVNFEGKPIGQVISTGLVIDADGENIGYITADSLIMDEENTVIGGVVPQGIAIGLDNLIDDVNHLVQNLLNHRVTKAVTLDDVQARKS